MSRKVNDVKVMNIAMVRKLDRLLELQDPVHKAESQAIVSEHGDVIKLIKKAVSAAEAEHKSTANARCC